MNIDSIRIGIAEDHPSTIKGMKTFFSDYDDIDIAFTAPNGLEFIEELKNHQIDVGIIDLQMKHMDGFKTIQVLRKDFPGIKIIVFTAHDKRSHLEKVMSAGAKAFVLKTDDFEVLAEALRNSIKNIVTISEDILSFSDTQRSILKLTWEGKSTAEIRQQLSLTERTVQQNRHLLYVMTGTSSIEELSEYAETNGYID